MLSDSSPISRAQCRRQLGQAVFDLRVGRVRQALLLMSASGKPPRRADVVRELAQTDATLAALGPEAAADRWLGRRVGFSDDALDFLWTAAALQVDPQLAPLAQKLVGLEARRGATLALHAAVFALDETSGRRLAAELEAHRGAGAARILLPAKEGDVLPSVPFVTPARVRLYLAGRDDIEPLVARFGSIRVAEASAAPVLDERQQRAEGELLRALEEDESQLVIVEGPAGVGRAAAVTRVAAELGRSVVELDLGCWEERLAPLEDVVAAWWRECLLRDGLGLLSHIDALPGEREGKSLAALIDRFPGAVAATARSRGELSTRRTVVRITYPLPEAPTRRELWRRATAESGVDLDLLASRYRLGASGIARAVRTAKLASGGEAPSTSALLAGVRASIVERVGDLATSVTTRESWDDLVLPEDTLAEVRALIARVRHAHVVYDVWGFAKSAARGQGVAAILSGPPGTGKTMVAGILARELELDLLVVDLSRVVSKWVGETEKQLATLFEAAEAGHSLLLFDEADALFAKRTTDVKGAVDRYSNLEVNYLLQRIESFGGITLLTTNLDAAIDPAIKRRLAAHIVFEAPDEDEREALWGRMLPPGAPIAGTIDRRALASGFARMTGANIRNAAIAAAFRAAAKGTAITMEILQQAARSEYQAMGRVLTANQ